MSTNTQIPFVAEGQPISIGRRPAADTDPVSNAGSFWQVLVLPPRGLEQNSDAEAGRSYVRSDRSNKNLRGPNLPSLQGQIQWSDEVGLHRNRETQLEQSSTVGLSESQAHEEAKSDASSTPSSMSQEFSRLILEAAHDIRSPISTAGQIVSSVANKMRREEALSKADLDMLDVANLRLMQANSWAEGMLLQRSLELGAPIAIRSRFYPPQVQTMVRPLIDSVATIRNVQVDWNGWDRSLPRLYTDANHISRAIVNLGTNAIQASQPGQRVAISVRGHARAASRLTIDIRDHGPGLGPQLLREVNRFDPRLFEAGHADPEKQDSKSASRPHGLGLRTAKSLITNLGGSLTARTPISGGTLFRISLPVDDPYVYVASWLIRQTSSVSKVQRLKPHRLLMHAVSIRDLDLGFGDLQIQQMTGPRDLVYRIAGDRWTWLSLVGSNEKTCTRVAVARSRLNQLSHQDRTVCEAELVFSSEEILLDDLQNSNDYRRRLPFLLNSIVERMRMLTGNQVPPIDDLAGRENVILHRPISKQRGHRFLRTDKPQELSAGAGSHLFARQQSSAPSAPAERDVDGLKDALNELAEDWHNTQSRLDRTIFRVDDPNASKPNATDPGEKRRNRAVRRR